MKVFTIDFETYYDDQYSLKKMSTEDYVNDPRFEIILVSVAVDDGDPVVFSADTCHEYTDYLAKLGIETGAVLAHNTMFDGLILTVAYGADDGGTGRQSQHDGCNHLGRSRRRGHCSSQLLLSCR